MRHCRPRPRTGPAVLDSPALGRVLIVRSALLPLGSSFPDIGNRRTRRRLPVPHLPAGVMHGILLEPVSGRDIIESGDRLSKYLERGRLDHPFHVPAGRRPGHGTLFPRTYFVANGSGHRRFAGRCRPPLRRRNRQPGRRYHVGDRCGRRFGIRLCRLYHRRTQEPRGAGRIDHPDLLRHGLRSSAVSLRRDVHGRCPARDRRKRVARYSRTGAPGHGDLQHHAGQGDQIHRADAHIDFRGAGTTDGSSHRRNGFRRAVRLDKRPGRGTGRCGRRIVVLDTQRKTGKTTPSSST